MQPSKDYEKYSVWPRKIKPKARRFCWSGCLCSPLRDQGQMVMVRERAEQRGSTQEGREGRNSASTGWCEAQASGAPSLLHLEVLLLPVELSLLLLRFLLLHLLSTSMRLFLLSACLSHPHQSLFISLFLLSSPFSFLAHFPALLFSFPSFLYYRMNWHKFTLLPAFIRICLFPYILIKTRHYKKNLLFLNMWGEK